MKSRMVILVFAILFTALPILAQDMEVASGFAASAPTLDGVISAGEYADAAIITFDGTDSVRPGVVGPDSDTIGGPNGDGIQSAADSSVIVYIMNDANNLYIAIDATDDILDFSLADIWRNDGAEIRVDGNMSRLTAKEDNQWGYSPTIRGDGGATSTVTGADITVGAAAKPDGTGWVIEFRTSTAGYEPVIGFDIAINDSDDPNSQQRDSQYRWNGLTDGGWQDETQWGKLILATVPNPGPVQKAVSGLAEQAPTLDGVLSEGEWADATVLYMTATDAIRPGVVGPDSDTIGGWNGDGFQSEADSSAWVYVMNDNDKLYIAIDAIDDVLDFSLSDTWRNDAAEIRVDGNFDKLSTKEGDVWGFSPVVRGDGGAADTVTGADIQTAGAPKPNGLGWVVEFSVGIDGFKPVVGFDIAIDDSDDPNSQSRDSQYRWNGVTDIGWNDETQWGELTLAGISSVNKNTWQLY